jgi:hypothetical protein
MFNLSFENKYFKCYYMIIHLTTYQSIYMYMYNDIFKVL